jgi:hypothetical protein
MTTHEMTIREATIRTAITRAYEDADLAPPTAASASRIVPLERLVAGQGLTHDELPILTRRGAAAFLSSKLPYGLEISGDGDDELSGYLYATNSQTGWVLMDRRDPITRRRFTVAHELGHYVLHAQPVLESGATVFSEVQPGVRRTDTEDEIGELGEVSVTGGEADTAPDTRRWEVEANQFAAELLMPEALCRELAAKYGPLCGGRRKVLAKRLGSELLVSDMAMSYRLRNLGLGQA